MTNETGSIEMPNNDEKKLEKSALILFGIFWVIIGIQTLFKPVYFFRGAYVDFTGHNIQVGIGFILIGFVFIAGYFRKGSKKPGSE